MLKIKKNSKNEEFSELVFVPAKNLPAVNLHKKKSPSLQGDCEKENINITARSL